MYAILVIDEHEAKKCTNTSVWEAFLYAAKSATEPPTQTQNLGGNCWLIPLQSEAHVFVAIASSAASRGIAYRATFFEKDLVWFPPKDTPS